MIEPMAIAGMIFSLLVIMMIGGFILLFPLTRRLGAYLEQRLEKGKAGYDDAEVRRLSASVAMLQAEVEKMAERQEFTDSLLGSTGTSSKALPRAGSAAEPTPQVSPGAPPADT